MLLVSGRDGTVVFEFAEEPLGGIAMAVEELREWLGADTVWPGADVCEDATRCEAGSQGIAVISPVGKECLAAPKVVQHIGDASTVMGLTGSDLEPDRQTMCIHERMDPGRQPAPRAPHASGVRLVSAGGFNAPFLLFAPC